MLHSSCDVDGWFLGTNPPQKGYCDFRTYHIRVAGSLADRVVANSGHRGIIAVKLGPQASKSKVAWSREESDAEYLVRTQSLACEQKLPLAFRQGGGHDLGLVGGDPGTFQRSPAVSAWQVFDVPRWWTQDDLLHFFEDVKWSKVEVLSRKRSQGKNGVPVWTIKGMPVDSSEGPFCISNGANLCLTISFKPRRSNPDVLGIRFGFSACPTAFREKLWKGWGSDGDKKRKPSPARKELTHPNSQESPERQRSRSPARKKTPGEVSWWDHLVGI